MLQVSSVVFSSQATSFGKHVQLNGTCMVDVCQAYVFASIWTHSHKVLNQHDKNPRPNWSFYQMKNGAYRLSKSTVYVV